MVGEHRVSRSRAEELQHAAGEGHAAMDGFASSDSRKTNRGRESMSGLSDKVVIVTGASRGIGRATAERLARDGASVVINYAVSGEEAKAVVEAIEARGGKAISLQADIARLE